LQKVEVLPSRPCVRRLRHRHDVTEQCAEAALDCTLQIDFLAAAKRAHVGLQLNKEGMLPITGDREEVDLVGTFGADLAEWKLRDDPRVDRSDAARSSPTPSDIRPWRRP